MRPDPADNCVALAQSIGDGRLGAQALTELATCLEPLRTSCWPELAWRASRLTLDGCPVEFAFSNRDDLLRITLEPAGPECEESCKLDRALHLLETLGGADVPAASIDHWRAVQRNARLRWGAWVGLREKNARLSAKLYVEIPGDAHRCADWTGSLNALTQMIGYEPGSRRLELYCALPEATTGQLAHLLARSGVGEPHAMLDMLENAIGLPLAGALRFIRIGFSVVVDDSHETRGATLFFRANAARRRLAWLRSMLSSGPGAVRRPASPYAGLLGQYSDSTLPDHGVIAITARPDGGIELRAGISAAALAPVSPAC
jgi:hypothetical protein